MGRAACVIGVDPGFANFGYGVMFLGTGVEWITEVSVIRTQKTNKKQNVKAAADNFRRAQEISKAFHKVVNKVKPAAIVAETMSFPRNASVAAKMAMAFGVLADICYVYDLPMVQATPQEIKKYLCDNKSATKEAVQEALLGRYPGQFDAFMKVVPRSKWEHGFDSIGAILTSLDSDVVRMARRMAEQG